MVSPWGKQTDCRGSFGFTYSQRNHYTYVHPMRQGEPLHVLAHKKYCNFKAL